MTKLFYLCQYIVFPVVLFITLNTTFTKMTVADCAAGVELACESLNK
tara:strand:+ start:261 stop:401 length:141 start_codon:yes stop_codon:yes gene_type:complete